MTVAELEERLGASELLDWIEYLVPPQDKTVPGNLLDMDPAVMVAEMTRK